MKTIFIKIKSFVISINKIGLFCTVGIHEWYYGTYSNPVWGRSERRCVNCEERQHRTYKPLKWKSYKVDNN